MSYDIKISDVTSNVTTDSNYNVTGDGSLDDLMETVTKHLVAQYDAGRISGTDYANVYMGLMQTVIAQAIQFTLQVPQAESQANLLLSQKDLTNEKINTESAQQDLIERQKQGFDDEFKNKLLKQVMDSWSVGFSVSQSSIAVPGTITVDNVDNITKSILNDLNIPVDVVPPTT